MLTRAIFRYTYSNNLQKKPVYFKYIYIYICSRHMMIRYDLQLNSLYSSYTVDIQDNIYIYIFVIYMYMKIYLYMH